MHVAGILFCFSEGEGCVNCVIPVVRIQALPNTVKETLLFSNSH